MSSPISREFDLSALELKNSDFNKVRKLLYEYSGIAISEGKEALVKARILKRIRKLGVKNFKDYFNYMEKDESGAEFLALVDVLTTNKTGFFRESAHFDFIRSEIIPGIQGEHVTWWSAGCSTGEEPISWAITCMEEKKAGFRGSARILATDISGMVINKAKQGLYSHSRLKGVPEYILRRYFESSPGNPHMYQAGDEVRSMIRYARLNLKENWPMKGPFHIIMCRNVMIYFDRITQQKLVDRFYNMLAPGGYLFIGHSETITEKHSGLTNVRPAVYRKK